MPQCETGEGSGAKSGWQEQPKTQGRGGTGIAGGCTGEMATSLHCVVLESSQAAEP